MKTQIRFGRKDLELYTKEKGKYLPYTKVELEDFMDVSKLPTFDHSISWKRHSERKFRSKVEYSKRKSIPPSRRKSDREQPVTGKKAALVHQHSQNASSVSRKKARHEDKEYVSSSSSSEDMEEEDETEENFSTPKGSSQAQDESI